MEEVVRAYEVLKKTRTIKKGLLTRCVNRLRAVVGQGADVQADTVDDARRRARLLLEELNNINVQMETVLLENDIAREDDEEGVSRPTARFVDVESNVEEVTAREIEIDKLQTGWTHDTQPADANANADVLAKTLEALSIITDKLVTPRESASIRTTGMHPPRWDGQNKNFYSWRLQLEQYFNSAGISKEADKLMYILHASVLPSRVTASIDSCTAMSGPNGVWCRLEEKIPKAAVVQEIIADMDGIRPIKQNAASEMRAVLDRLTDFARRITEIGNESELDSPTVVRIVSSKLEPELYYECERWMRQNHPAEQLSVNRIVEFLRAETEARERLMPAKSTRTEKKSSLHHVNGTGTSFTDPCILGCGVHHKFIDCQAFQAMQPAQRRDVIRTARRCFSCYGRHRSSDCTRPKRCIECGDRHHRLLNCQPNRQLSAPTSTTRRASPPTSQMNPASASFTPQQGAATSTPTFLGHLYGNQGRFSPSTYVEVRDSTGAWHKIVAFLDTGSDTTLVRHSLAKRLGITGDDQVFRYGVAGGGVRSEKSARYVLRVRPVQRDASIAYDIIAMGIKVPAHDAPAIDSSLFQQYEYLQPARDCVPLAKEKIDLLVGYDQAYLISTLHTISSPTNEAQLPSAACTRLGWVLYGGQIQPPRAVARSAVHHVQRLIEDDIKKLFYSDVAGVKPTTACICSDKELAESKFLLHAKTTTSITKEGRIKVFMPWRDGYPEALPFNKEKTVARMYQQENSLRRNGRLEAYNAEIRNLITQGFVRPLTIEETHDGRGWYLEHHAVYREDKSTTKTRIVWNAAALFKGVSLNDGFHKGPDLLNSLISCLLAWRRDRVALVGDVKKMFNQIEVAEPDQIFHRFVWRFGDECSPPIAFQWIRLPFGERPAPDIAINSVRILAEIGRQSEPIGSYIVDNEMYMDDISHSTATAEDAIRARDEVDAVLARGKFDIKTWHSNHAAVDDNPDEPTIDVLGHHWDKSLDLFSLKAKDVEMESDPVTKRTILSLVAKIWDPLGVLSPVSLAFRIDLQDLWRRGVSWDEPLDDDDKQRWNTHVIQMQELLKFQVPRCVKPNDSVGKPQLHCFSDGGANAYGAVLWLRWPLSNGATTTTFVMAKALVAPLKKKSIPRLELMAAVIMSRLAKFIEDVMGGFDSIHFWVDSQTVLKWVRSASANFKPFVSARIQEIQDTHPRFMDEFRYVPSNMNTADALTKPLSVRELQYWHEGPLFLRQHEDTWPQESTCEQDSEIEAATRIEGRNEKARTPRHRRIHHVRANDVCIADMTIADRLVAQVSEWDRLTRHVARWRRILQPRVNRADTRTIGAEELKDAQQALFFLCQSEFREDFAACRSTFASIAPVLDAKGIVRAEGRIGQLPLHPDVCHPIILPGNSPLVELYARRKHIRYLHQGYRVVLANIAKEGIHIGNGKELLKSVASKCLYCRTRRESMLQQQMGILPAFRGNPCTPPFAAVAVDFFGPLQTKVSRNVTTESSVMIVTCTTTRVVHLELTSSASTESFLLAWRRFVSRRGVHPTTVFSDRGKNFQGAQRPLRDAIDSWDVSRLKRELAAERTHFEWQFNVPKASHMNGVVESLIRSCRRGLDAAVNYLKRRFTFEEWQTFLSEVMYVINSRPLFPDGPDPVGSPAVTGNDILHPFDQPTVPQPVVEDRPHPREVVKALHQRVQLFWETWLRFMPPHLIARSKWFHSRQNLQVGDLVLLLEPGMKGAAAPRALWERAVVTAVQPGDDGLVRKATVRTANARLYDRPIHNAYEENERYHIANCSVYR